MISPTSIQQHIVAKGTYEIRFIDYVFQHFRCIPSRAGIKKAIKRGQFTLDGNIAVPGKWIEEGQVIELFDLVFPPSKEYYLDLEVLFEDAYMAVVNKPAGIVVSGNQFKTIENALPHNLESSNEVDVLAWPRPVHRLDSPTSGVLLVAKTRKAQINLGQQFEQKRIQKGYRAILIGEVEASGMITESIEGLESKSAFELISKVPSLQNGFLSLVNLYPLTGRTHQLRIHTASIGHPIMGDKLYGNQGQHIKGKGLFLSAVSIEFKHPITKEDMSFIIDEPAKFKSLLNREESRFHKFNSDKL